MALTPAEFTARLSAAKLMSEDDANSLLASIPPSELLADGDGLAEYLVRGGKLTPYQAKRLCDGKVAKLVLGNYVILDRLGQGGMGTVFKAEHRQMKRPVALKIVRPEFLASPNAAKRFQREVETVARLDHPNIVAAFDADEVEGVCFLAMQFVSGHNLSAIVRQSEPLPVAQAVDWVLQAARGLAYAHGQGIIHRDVKPSNLLLDGKGTIKILDLGLATLLHKEAGGPETLTGSHTIVGTIDYMAPEQAESSKLADERSDIYSLGMTLWFLLTGRIAYDDESEVDKLLAHREQPIPSLREARPEIPAELDAIFRRMAAKLPAERYPAMQRVVAVLEAFQQEHSAQFRAAASAGTEPTLNWVAPASQSGAQPPGNSGAGAGTADDPTIRPTAANHAHQGDTTKSPRIAAAQGPTKKRAVGRWLAFTSVAAILILVPLAAWRLAPFFFATGPTQESPDKALVGNGSSDEEPGIGADLGANEPETLPVVNETAPTISPPKDLQQRVVEVVLKHGGNLKLMTVSQMVTVDRAENIPQEPFVVEGIYLKDQKVVDENSLRALEELPYLAELSLHNTDVGDATVRRVAQIAGLRHLALLGTKISDEAAKLLSVNGDLQYLQLARTRISDAAGGDLAKLPNLHGLVLDRTQIGDAGLRDLAGQRVLRWISLGEAKRVTNAGVAHLQSLPELQVLSLGGTAIDDDSVDTFLGMPQLRYIDVGGTKVTAEGASRLQAGLPQAIVLHASLANPEAEVKNGHWLLEQGASVTTTSGLVLKEIPTSQFFINSVNFPPKDGPTGGAENLTGLRLLTALSWPNLKNADQEAESIAKLDSLTNLRLNGDLSDAGLLRLAALSQLRYLYLDSNGKLTDEALKHLPRLAHLRMIGLSSTSISDAGLVPLRRLPNLSLVNLSHCPKLTSAGLAHLTTATHLRHLELAGDQIDDTAVPHLTQMQSLRVLKIPQTRISALGIAELKAALPKCAIFLDGGAIIPGAAGAIVRAPAAEPKPIIPGTAKTTVQTPPTVAAEPKPVPVNTNDVHHRVVELVLKHGGAVSINTSSQGLNVTRTADIPNEPFRVDIINLNGRKDVTDENLSEIKGLTYLSGAQLDWTSVGDQAVIHLQGPAGLTWLNLPGTGVTDEGVKALTSQRDLRALVLSHTRISNSACGELKRITNLRTLGLNGTAISDSGLAELASLTALRRLSLSGCKGITTAGIAHLRSLPALQLLHLDDTPIGDESIDVLAGFARLRLVDVSSTKLTIEGAQRLQAVLPRAVVIHPALPPGEAESTAARWMLDNKGELVAWSHRTLSEVPPSPFGVQGVTLPSGNGAAWRSGLFSGLRSLDYLVWHDLKNSGNELDSITTLDSLTWLGLPNFALSDRELERLALALPQLDVLQFAGSEAHSSRGLEHLAALKHLRYLGISGLQVNDDGLAPLGRLTSLRTLGLSAPNTTSAGIKHLIPLINLRHLNLSRAAIDDAAVEYLKQIPSLRILEIHDANVTNAGVAQLQRALPNCAIFWKGGAVIPEAANTTVAEDSAPKPVPVNTNDAHHRVVESVLKHGGTAGINIPTRWLKVSRTEDVPSEPFRVNTISLDRKEVTDEAVKAVQGLPFLSGAQLDGTGIGDETVRLLRGPDGLEWLNLPGTGVTDEGVKALTSQRDLFQLVLCDTRISNSACEILKKIATLRNLELDRTAITDAGLEDLASLTALRRLSLSGCKEITTAGVAHLRSLPALQLLHLDDTQIGDEAIEALAGFGKLRFVNVSSTKMTSEGALRLQAALPRAVVIHPAIPRSEPEATAARWALDQKAELLAWRYQTLLEVPPAPFTVQGVKLPPASEAAWRTGLFSGLRSLEYLVWQDLKNSGHELDSIATLDSVTWLGLPNFALSDKELERVARALPQLENLSFGGSEALGSRGLEQLAALKHLRQLSTGGLQVDDNGLAPLGHLTSLRHLTIGAPKMTSAGVKQLIPLVNLRGLNLYLPAIDDAAVEHLKQMPSLRFLDVRYSTITKAGVAELKQALPKCTIFWSGGSVIPEVASPATSKTP